VVAQFSYQLLFNYLGNCSIAQRAKFGPTNPIADVVHKFKAYPIHLKNMDLVHALVNPALISKLV
jgi:hypothetical protein